jgi:hypothetical protein
VIWTRRILHRKERYGLYCPPYVIRGVVGGVRGWSKRKSFLKNIIFSLPTTRRYKGKIEA